MNGFASPLQTAAENILKIGCYEKIYLLHKNLANKKSLKTHHSKKRRRALKGLKASHIALKVSHEEGYVIENKISFYENLHL